MRMVCITFISPTKTSASVTEQDCVAGVDCVAGKVLAGDVSIHHISYVFYWIKVMTTHNLAQLKRIVGRISENIAQATMGR